MARIHKKLKARVRAFSIIIRSAEIAGLHELRKIEAEMIHIIRILSRVLLSREPTAHMS